MSNIQRIAKAAFEKYASLYKEAYDPRDYDKEDARINGIGTSAIGGETFGGLAAGAKLVPAINAGTMGMAPGIAALFGSVAGGALAGGGGFTAGHGVGNALAKRNLGIWNANPEAMMNDGDRVRYPAPTAAEVARMRAKQGRPMHGPDPAAVATWSWQDRMKKMINDRRPAVERAIKDLGNSAVSAVKNAPLKY